ncbi:MAG: glycosyltransferase family 2 protein, partial [Actinobacteria bacterium]|nr:glycosyltransferase family 2 protein [Actinomycetota bacterium]
LPLGWLGKNFACHQLSLASQSDYLVFIDADVRLSPSAIQSAIRTMQICNWDFISPYPAQIAITPIEQLIQPLLQWSWFATVPLYIAQKFRIRSMAVANGQFLIVSRAAYLKCGGHEAIKGEVIDDIELARLLLKSGFNGGVADGSAISNCRMYKSSAQLINGYRKSLWRAFGSPIGSIFAITLLTLSSIVPFIYALNGSILGWVGYMAITTSRLVTALKVKSRWETAFLHPLSIAALIALICWSWIGKMRGELKWRGRNV